MEVVALKRLGKVRALGVGNLALHDLPEAHEKKVQAQLPRRAIRAADATIYYILFSELRQHCEALCKFGDTPTAMRKIAWKVA
jgi:type II restriction enzyme